MKQEIWRAKEWTALTDAYSNDSLGQLCANF